MLKIITISFIITVSIIFYSCDNKSNPVDNKIDTTNNNDVDIVITIDKSGGSPGNSINVSINKIVDNKESAKIFFGEINVPIQSSNYYQNTTRFYVTIPDSLTKISKVSAIFDNKKDTCKNLFYFYIPEKLKLISFYPEQGVTGSKVIIQGIYLSPAKYLNSIYFGDIKAKIDSIYFLNDYDYIIAEVPKNALTSHLFIDNGNRKDSSFKLFKVISDIYNDTSMTNQVVIYDFSPKYAYYGAEVQIIADNINPDITKNSVYFNGTEAEIISLIPEDKPKILITKVPDNATSGKIKLIAGDYSDETLEDFVIVPNNKPVFSFDGFEPKEGLPDSGIKIHGSNFGTNINDIKVLLGNTETQITSIFDTLIFCIVPCFSEPSQITIIKNNNTITSNDFYYPAHFFSLQFELGNVNVKFHIDTTIKTLFFIPMTVQYQKLKEDPYSAPNEFDFGSYHLTIGTDSYLTLKLNNVVFTDRRERSSYDNHISYWLHEYDAFFTIKNIKYENIDNNGTFTFEVYGYDINKYLTDIHCQKYEHDVDYNPPFNNVKTKIDYMVWDKAIRSDSYLKITLKRCH